MGMKMCDGHGWSLLSLGFFTCVAKTGWEMECTETHWRSGSLESENRAALCTQSHSPAQRVESVIDADTENMRGLASHNRKHCAKILTEVTTRNEQGLQRCQVKR